MISIQEAAYSDDILVLRSTGALSTKADLDTYLKAGLAFYQHHNPLFVILDETEVTNNLGLIANFGFADRIIENMLLLDLKKMAIITREADFENNQEFANFLNAKEINLRVFLNKGDALIWITEEA